MRVSLSIQSCSRSEQRSPACSVSVSDLLFCEAYSCLFILWKRFVFRDFLHSFSSYFKFTMSKQEWSLWGQQWGFLHRKIKKKQPKANQPSKPNHPVTGSCTLWLAEGDELVSAVLLDRAGHLPVGFGIPPLAPDDLHRLSRWVGSAVQHPSCCHGTSSHGLGFAFWPLPERAETL